MTFLVIILVTIAFWLIFSPYIKPWLRRRAERKLTDYLRSQMGMPTEKEMRKAQKEAEKREQRQNVKNGFWSRPRGATQQSSQHAPKEIIPREYAVDVEFTEVRQFSQTTIAADAASAKAKGRKVVVESQVSDVEYTEIKIKDVK